jgi:hypothetical protein
MAEARPGNRRITVGADKAYDAAGFVAALRERNATPHVAQTPATGARRSTAAPPAIPVTRSAAGGANASRRSSDGPRRRPDCARPVIAGVARVGWIFALTATAYNLVRLPKLLGAAA